jgi:hypothetical protein
MSIESSGRSLGPAGDGEDTPGEGPPVPAYLGTARDDSDFEDGRPNRKDYAVREVDFYYRVRGPALSHTGTRKLKTGPADPTGPVSSATGWFRRLLGGKTKEKGKGFEVVRSTRVPPPGLFPPAEGDEYHEPYRDDPDTAASDGGGHSREISGGTVSSYHDSEGDERPQEEREAPQLPQIDAGGAIELPSRIGSRSSAHPPSRIVVPQTVPQTLAAIPGSPPADRNNSGLLHPSDSDPGRLPFTASDSSSKRAGSVDSMSTVHRTTSDEQGQPSGMGYVSHHRAGASIHDPAGGPPLTGSTAELVDQSTDSEE